VSAHAQPVVSQDIGYHKADEGDEMFPIRESIEQLQARIKAKLVELGRADEEVTLVAVTKTQPVDVIEVALQHGISHIGENKVQEALRKIPLLKTPYQGFHFIGHLQSNKINNLLSLKPLLIQSVDSFYIAQKLNSALGRKNLVQDILVQVNTTSEASKSGVSLNNAIPMIGQISRLNNINIKGLMTIGLMSSDPELTRPFFKKLKELFERVKELAMEGVEMKYLSMGMSDDYLVAVEEGANMVRIGSVIFGPRVYPEGA